MKRLFLSLLLITQVSCATIVSGGSNQDYASINSDIPTKVLVEEMNGKQSSFTADTPFILTMYKNNDYILTFKKEGYKEKRIQTVKQINGWFWGNILLQVWPMIIDYITGCMWEHTIKEINIKMEK